LGTSCQVQEGEIYSLSKGHTSIPISTIQKRRDTPACIVALSGKSAADFEAHYEKIWEVLGEEAMALVNKLVALARGFEIKNAWFRPDLSYIPKEE